MVSAKVIRKTIEQAAKHGWFAVQNEKYPELYNVKYQYARSQTMTFSDLQDRAYNFSGKWR